MSSHQTSPYTSGPPQGGTVPASTPRDAPSPGSTYGAATNNVPYSPSTSPGIDSGGRFGEPLSYVPPDELPEAPTIPAQGNQWTPQPGPYVQPEAWAQSGSQYGSQYSQYPRFMPQMGQYTAPGVSQFASGQYAPQTGQFIPQQGQYAPQPGTQSQPFQPQFGQFAPQPASVIPPPAQNVAQTRSATLPPSGQIVPAGGCSHVKSTTYSTSGILCCLACFPCGMLCCCADREQVCEECGEVLHESHFRMPGSRTTLGDVNKCMCNTCCAFTEACMWI